MIRRTGADVGLSAERDYVRIVLPRGVAGGVADAARGDLGGLGRAAAIVLGLMTTSAGFLVGRVRNGAARS